MNQRSSAAFHPVVNIIRNYFTIVAILTVVAGPVNLFAQLVQPTLNIHTDKLSQDERDYLAGFEEALLKAGQVYQWTDGKYSYPLPVQWEIYFDKYSQTGFFHRYTVGLLVALPTGIQLRDKRCEFQYAKEDRLYFGEPYHTLTALIEFYTMICLGFEADRIAPLGGSQYYERARTIGEMARGEPLFANGWTERRQFAAEFADTTYNSIRQARFYIEAGNYFARKNNAEQTLANFEKAVRLLQNSPASYAELHREDHIIRFVDLPALALSLQQEGLDDLLESLSRWDTEHPELYR